MPYKVGKHASCPSSKPHAVLKEDGSVVPGGCHETHGKALAHQRALMVNVPDAQKATEFTQGLAQAELDANPALALESFLADNPGK